MNPSVYQQAIHLVEHQLLSEIKECLFCNNKSLRVVGRLQKDPGVDLLQCSRCFAVSTSRIPRQNFLQEFYKEYYKEDTTNVTFSQPKNMAEHIYDYLTSAIRHQEQIEILDFGGGDGSIAVAIAQKLKRDGVNKINVTLVDYTPNIKQDLPSNIVIEKYKNLPDLQKQSKHFKIIIASAIIEHLPAPKDDLVLLFSKLARGGMFYARTPYILPLMKLAAMLGVKIDFNYPSHLHDLGDKFWNNLINWLPSAGRFRVVNSRPSIVETSLKDHFFRTLLAYGCKIPWWIFGKRYHLVGGWEIFIEKTD